MANRRYEDRDSRFADPRFADPRFEEVFDLLNGLNNDDYFEDDILEAERQEHESFEASFYQQKHGYSQDDYNYIEALRRQAFDKAFDDFISMEVRTTARSKTLDNPFHMLFQAFAAGWQACEICRGLPLTNIDPKFTDK